jgi:hypothetical protein
MYRFQLSGAAQSLVDALPVAKNFRMSDCLAHFTDN